MASSINFRPDLVFVVFHICIVSADKRLKSSTWSFSIRMTNSCMSKTKFAEEGSSLEACITGSLINLVARLRNCEIISNTSTLFFIANKVFTSPIRYNILYDEATDHSVNVSMISKTDYGVIDVLHTEFDNNRSGSLETFCKNFEC